MYSNTVLKRYSRQIFLEEIGLIGQQKIMNSKVLIIGAGGLGSPVIQYLATAGVGTIAVVDFDIVQLHNLNRQIIHSENFVGKPKVNSAEAYVQQHNSEITFVPIQDKVTDENVLELCKDYDIVIDGSDNFPTRYCVNDACVHLQKPLVYGSIFSFEGQFAVFNYQGSKNLRDIFPEPIGAQGMPNCDAQGVLGPLPGMIGAMMAMQALKIMTDLPVDINQLTVINLKEWRFDKLNF